MRSAKAAYRVVCVGEGPPGWLLEQARMAGVEFVHVDATEACDRLGELDARGYVMNSFGPAEGPRVTDDLLDRAPQLEVATYMGASRELGDYRGYVDIEAVRRRGIAFTSTATADGNHPVAEGTLALLAALDLNLVDVHNTGVHPGTRSGLSGRVLGIVGMGQVGHRVAELVAPLGMRLLYHSRHRHRDVEEAYDAHRLDLGDLFAAADHVSIHLANSAPAGFVGADALARAAGITLVNTTSAPGLVEPVALVAALDEGRVRRAAIEGSYPEPHHSALRARGSGKVVMLPAYTTWDTAAARALGWQNVLATYAAAASGEPIPHRLS